MSFQISAKLAFKPVLRQFYIKWNVSGMLWQHRFFFFALAHA